MNKATKSKAFDFPNFRRTEKLSAEDKAECLQHPQESHEVLVISSLGTRIPYLGEFEEKLHPHEVFNPDLPPRGSFPVPDPSDKRFEYWGTLTGAEMLKLETWEAIGLIEIKRSAGDDNQTAQSTVET